MIRKSPLLLFFVLFCSCQQVVAGIVFTSLPNPNVYPIFVILEEKYLEAEFIPSRGGPATLLSLLSSGQANVAVLNENTAHRIADRYNWRLLPATIYKAVYLLSYTPVRNSADIGKLKIISAFPGGSPDRVFQAGNFSVTPKFTDLFLAVQLFQQREFDALLLPEPHISRVAGLLRAQGETFYLIDMQQMALNRDRFPVNAGIMRHDVDAEPLEKAFSSAIDFIRRYPEKTARIVSRAFEKYFHKPLPETAVIEALNSGRLLFAMEASYQK